jgi:hypothetical protein
MALPLPCRFPPLTHGAGGTQINICIRMQKMIIFRQGSSGDGCESKIRTSNQKQKQPQGGALCN